MQVSRCQRCPQNTSPFTTTLRELLGDIWGNHEQALLVIRRPKGLQLMECFEPIQIVFDFDREGVSASRTCDFDKGVAPFVPDRSEPRAQGVWLAFPSLR